MLSERHTHNLEITQTNSDSEVPKGRKDVEEIDLKLEKVQETRRKPFWPIVVAVCIAGNSYSNTLRVCITDTR